MGGAAVFESGRIHGTVNDGSGAVVPAGAIALEPLTTGNVFRTETNSTGFFVFIQTS